MKKPSLTIILLMMICFCSLVLLSNSQAQQQIPNYPFPPYYPFPWPTQPYPQGGQIYQNQQQMLSSQQNILLMQNMMNFYLMQIQMPGFSYPWNLTSSSSKTSSPKLSYEVETLKSIYDSGEGIVITFKVRNSGTGDATILFATRQRFEVIIENKEGELVWRHSQNIQYENESSRLEVRSKKSKNYEVQWDQNNNINMEEVTSGTYIIKAHLTSKESKYNKVASKRIAIRCLPRLSSCEELKEILKRLRPTPPPPPVDPNTNKTVLSEDNGSDDTRDPPIGAIRPGAAYSFAYGGLFGGLYGAYGAGYAAYGAPITGGISYQAFQPSYALFGAPAAMGYSGWGAFTAFAPLGGISYTGLYTSSAYTNWGGYGALNTFSGGYSSPYLNTSFSSPTTFGGSFNYAQPSFLYGQTRYRKGSDGSGASVNVQTVGIDEADIIKYDGSYIYMIKDKTVRIIETSFEGLLSNVKRIDFTNTHFTPEYLYVHGNILVIIGTEPRGSIKFYPDYKPLDSTREDFTKIFLYDVTYPEDCEPIRDFKFEADYLQSKKVDSTLYVIMNETPHFDFLDKEDLDLRHLLPVYHDSEQFYYDSNIGNIICNCDEISYFPGYTEPNYLIVVGIPLTNIGLPMSREFILGESEKVYSSIENLYVTNSYREEDSTLTLIYKFRFDFDESIKYMGSGKISGEVVDQFSMNEYNDYFRLITTDDSTSTTIYLFDQDLTLTGSLNVITGGDEVTSIRFLEDQCYFVTSNDTTPFHVISLSDPLNPWLEGEANILGDCEYLHPYDAQHMICFSKNAQGSNHKMTIKLFNITEILNPFVIDQYNISQYLYTNVYYRGFVLDKQKDLMAFPILVTDSDENDLHHAYILDTDENGFVEGRQVTHEDRIKRIAISDEYYYTISDCNIKAFSIQGHIEGVKIVLD